MNMPHTAANWQRLKHNANLLLRLKLISVLISLTPEADRESLGLLFKLNEVAK